MAAKIGEALIALGELIPFYHPVYAQNGHAGVFVLAKGLIKAHCIGASDFLCFTQSKLRKTVLKTYEELNQVWICSDVMDVPPSV